MKSSQDVFRHQIEAVIERTNKVILDFSVDLKSQRDIERCSQVINLIKFAKEALERGNIGGALGVAQEAEAEATSLYVDLLDSADEAPEDPQGGVLELEELDEEPADSEVSPMAGAERPASVLPTIQTSEVPVGRPEDLVAEARHILAEIASNGDHPAIYQACMAVKDLIAEVTRHLGAGRVDEALPQAQRALDAARKARELCATQGEVEERRKQIEGEVLHVRTELWSLGEEDGPMVADVRRLTEEAQKALAAGEFDGAMNAIVEAKVILARPKPKPPAPVPDGEKEQRLSTLESLSSEWGLQVFEGALKILADGAASGDRHVLAAALQGLISRSLLTGRPMNEEMARAVIKEKG